MLTKLRKSQKLISAIKNFARNNAEVWDVIAYGSAVRGKEDARDVDLAIILSKKTGVDRKLSLAQGLKESLEKFFSSIDVKAIDIDDLFDANFLARQGIIAEGYRLIKKQSLAQSIGFRTFVFIKYSLKRLTYAQKKMLYYALKGRRGSKGVLETVGGELISRELLKIPIEASYTLEELLRMHKVSFTSESAMVYKKR
ncbi:MAG: nucleotidyltransferase domain-containing protein [Nanoarchaeota archaeon]